MSDCKGISSSYINDVPIIILDSLVIILIRTYCHVSFFLQPPYLEKYSQYGSEPKDIPVHFGQYYNLLFCTKANRTFLFNVFGVLVFLVILVVENLCFHTFT